MAVHDAIYNSPETLLLQLARLAGCFTRDDLDMVLRQEALTFERWAGRSAPLAAMREVLPS